MSARRAGALVLAAGLVLAACEYTTEDDPPAAGDAPATTGVDGSSTTAPGEAATTTTVGAVDLGSIALGLEEVAELDEPVALAPRAGQPTLYVAEKGGQVRRISVAIRRNLTLQYTLERGAVVDLGGEVLNDGEQGLLGLAFSPDGARLYLAFTGTDAQQHLVEFEMDGEQVQPRSRRDLLTIPDFAPNHNGGQLAFGPDGFLYWGMGDGGGGGDPEETGQDPDDLLGSILRIDPDVAPEDRDSIPYAVPDGNPFVGGGGAPEVWAYGLRNPWRFSFDRETGDLWIADVGQEQREEIDVLPATGGTGAGRGANLGWSEVEGDQPYEGGTAPADAVAPIFSYPHADGACSVTGGYVYRGTRVPFLQGVYLYADYCRGELRGLLRRDGEVFEDSLGLEVPNPTSFGQDGDGELYVLSQAGPIYRIIPAG